MDEDEWLWNRIDDMGLEYDYVYNQPDDDPDEAGEVDDSDDSKKKPEKSVRWSKFLDEDIPF